MSQVAEPCGKSAQSFPTSLSHEARAAFNLLKVAGIAASACSHVEVVKSSVAPLACRQAADSAPLLVQIFCSQAPQGPAAAPLPAGAAESAFSAAFACWRWPNQPAAPPARS